jgi:hypothetical protein
MFKSCLRYPICVLLWVVVLMSGGSSLFRELYGIYSGRLPARSLFWSCAWIAFVVSAAVLWAIDADAMMYPREKLSNKDSKQFVATAFFTLLGTKRRPHSGHSN